MRFRLSIDGVNEVDRMLSAKEDAVSDFRPVWPQVADVFVKHEQEVFAQDGSVQGWEAWTPLNPGYAHWKAKHGYSPEILRKTGDLEKSLTNRNDTNFVFQAGRRSLTIGTSDPKARIHRYGGKDGKPPKREPIRVTDELRRNWVKVIQTYIVKTGSTERHFI